MMPIIWFLCLAVLSCWTCAAKLALQEPCSSALSEERLIHMRQLAEAHARHEAAIKEIRTLLDNQTRELEALRRTCVSASSPMATVSLDGSRPLRPERRTGRGLLRSGSEAGHCANEELQRVLDVAGAGKEATKTASLKLLLENPPCGECIAATLLPAAGSNDPGVAVDVLKGLYRCLHQQENVCNQTTDLSTIDAMLPFAVPSNRSSIIRLLELVDAGMLPLRSAHDST
jgi:hypothetical protein